MWDFFAAEKGVILNKSISWSDFSRLYQDQVSYERTYYLKIYRSKMVHFKSDYKVSAFLQHSHTSQTIFVVTSIIKQTNIP